MDPDLWERLWRRVRARIDAASERLDQTLNGEGEDEPPGQTSR